MADLLIGTWLIVSLLIGFIIGFFRIPLEIREKHNLSIILAILFWPITTILLLLMLAIATSADVGEWIRDRL